MTRRGRIFSSAVFETLTIKRKLLAKAMKVDLSAARNMLVSPLRFVCPVIDGGGEALEPLGATPAAKVRSLSQPNNLTKVFEHVKRIVGAGVVGEDS